MIIHAMTEASYPQLNGVAALPHLGVIRVEGEDAARFLQGQLTQDFVLLDTSQARLAAFCSAKGRMQASFIGFKRGPTEILLVCSRDILSATLKRLSMFVLRAKARLNDASAEFQLLGIAGDALESIAEEGHSVLGKADFNDVNLIWLHPAGTQPRALWIAPTGVPRPRGPVLETELWHWGDVRSGVATVTGPIVDAFVPQMLNYESVGGVNFKKGCYPGQEVVARSQFRGILKRRAYLAHGEAPMQAGQEVFAASDAEQPCGLVAQSAPAPSGGCDAIVSLQVSAADKGDLHLGSAQGPLLTLLPLPYALLADI
jgi:tRNA-modifying protein YgfZ